MTVAGVMAAVAAAVAAPMAVLRAVQTDARTPVVNARKDAMKGANALTSVLKVVRTAAARIALWARAVSHKAAKPAAKPALTTATLRVAKYVWKGGRTVSNAPSHANRENPASRVNPGQMPAGVTGVAASAVSLETRAPMNVAASVSNVMLPSRTRHWLIKLRWPLR